MTRRFSLSFGSALLAVLALSLGSALAQEPPAQQPPAQQPAAEPAAEASPLIGEGVDVSQIEEILRGEEEVMQGGILAYDPAGRRDPFRSLLQGFEEKDEALTAKPRPPGLPGMLVEELKVEGIIETPSGILAFVLGRDNVSYIIRPGTKLYNGEVAEIQPKKVIFRQYVNDPSRVKPYDEIVRELTD